MFLFSDVEATDPILGLTDHVNLESDGDFQERYVGHLQFDLPGNG